MKSAVFAQLALRVSLDHLGWLVSLVHQDYRDPMEESAQLERRVCLDCLDFLVHGVHQDQMDCRVSQDLRANRVKALSLKSKEKKVPLVFLDPQECRERMDNLEEMV